MGWVTIKEYCEHEGIKIRTFQYRKKANLLQWRYGTSGRGGDAGKHIEVWIDEETQKAESSKQKADKKEKPRTRINHGEPGCHVVTPIIDGLPASQSAEGPPLNLGATSVVAHSENQNIETPPSEINIETSPTSMILPPASGSEEPLARRDGGVTSNLPVIIDKTISPKALRTANLRFAVIQAFNEEAARNHRPRVEIITHFLEIYHSNLVLPEIHAQIKKLKRSTLYNWLQLYEQGGLDALTPQYRGAADAKTKILPGEKDFLLKFLLSPNKPKISDGIRECKRNLGDYSTSGPAALRRFVNHFKTYYHDTWTLKRDGEKAWNDEDAPYQDRDPMLLNVGDVLVADGHRLNINVLDPISGKKKRATLVLFWDWKSTYPLGWEIMFSENIQCIAAALRNALLALGKIPSNIYIDNGKAFLSKIFTRSLRVEETEIPGMIARLGSRYRRAMPYHGQSKPIERFFLIINDRLERRLPSYTGASIKDKPPYLLRNEKLAKQLHDDWVPTVDELFAIMLQWREEYIDEPRPARQGLTARQIFEEGKGAGLDPKALCFLMMAVEVKSVRRSRFTFAGTDWEGPCIYGYRGRIIIRYSLSDLAKIYVFDPSDQFMGTVTQCGKADPIRDWQAAKRIVAERRTLKRHTKALAQYIDEKRFVIEGRRNVDMLPYIESEDAKKPHPKILSAFLDEPADDAPAQAPREAAQTASPGELSRPRWKYDYEKYDWLMLQDKLTPEDRKWIEDYRANSSLYKHTVFDDAEKLDQKMIGGANERSFRSDQID